MSTKRLTLTCPHCKHHGPADHFVGGGELEESLSRFPDALRLHLPYYLGLFAKEGKAVTAKKAAKVLDEVYAITGHFDFDRVTYRPNLTACVRAFEAVEDSRVTPPLSNHNYLKRCLITAINRTTGDAPAKGHAPEPATPAADQDGYRQYVRDAVASGLKPEPLAEWRAINETKVRG